MVAVTTIYTIGAIGMVLGTVGIAVGLWPERTTHPRRYAALLGVTGIAAVAYAVMASGLGAVSTNGAIINVPRYVDWLLTTPLLLAYLVMLAGGSTRLLGITVGLDVVVILGGLAGALMPKPVGYVPFAVAAAAFAGVVYLLYGPLSRAARANAGGDEPLFRKLRNVIGVLWSIYPLVWLAGPPGLQLLTVTTAATVVVYLDIITKAVFGLIVVNYRGGFDRVLGATQAGERGVADDDQPTASAADDGQSPV
jgi:sensory rhodopsin